MLPPHEVVDVRGSLQHYCLISDSLDTTICLSFSRHVNNGPLIDGAMLLYEVQLFGAAE